MMQSNRRSLFLVALILLEVPLLTVCAGPTGPVATVPATPSFNRYMLQDTQGRIVTNETWLGSYVLVSFGYMNCSDVCPTTLWDFKVALDVLEDEAPRIRPVFIGLDPNRDDPDVLKEYTSHFHPDIVSLTGTPGQIRAAADSFRLNLAFEVDGQEVHTPPTDGSDYHIRYAGRIYLLGPDGNLLRAFRAGTSGMELADTIAEAMETEADASLTYAGPVSRNRAH